MNTVRFRQHLYQPSKIICVGRNYHAHAKELNNPVPTEPVLFIKPNSSISCHVRRRQNELLHYEAELCFLFMEHQWLGLGIGLDLTKRKLQDQLKQQGLPWERAKAFDGSAVFSEFIPCPQSIDDLRLELWINQELRQHGAVKDMIFTPQSLLSNINEFMTLEDGDILMTGTPAGVGEVKAGDHYQARIYQGNTLLLEQSWTVD